MWVHIQHPLYSNNLLMKYLVWNEKIRLTYEPFYLFSVNLLMIQRKLTVGKEMRILYNVPC